MHLILPQRNIANERTLSLSQMSNLVSMVTYGTWMLVSTISIVCERLTLGFVSYITGAKIL